MKKILKNILYSFVSLIFVLGSFMKINAASANISVSSNSSKVVVGNTFTVTVKISSSVAMGTWEWTIDYDTKKFKLVSGESNVADVYQNENTKSKSYTYKFKAIAAGNGKISVKSAGAIDMNENSMSLSVGSKTVTVITQAQLEASYSKNNNLKSLSVEGYSLSPEFNKDTTEYTVTTPSNTEKIKVIADVEDSKSSISGAGEFEVEEGENKIQVVVTAENGSTKTYTIIINVKDDNPIEVNINDELLTVVKRSSNLVAPNNFENTEITINDIKVPAFYSQINDYYLVGLKNKEGETNLYIYNEKDNSYTLYTETKLNQLLLQPLPIEKIFENYTKGTVIINDIEFESYSLNNSNYYIIHAKELTSGKDNYYLYDKTINTAIIYTDEETEIYKETNEKYLQLILLLGAETIIVFIILLILLIVSIVKKNKRKKLRKQKMKQEKENNKKHDNKKNKNNKENKKDDKEKEEKL